MCSAIRSADSPAGYGKHLDGDGDGDGDATRRDGKVCAGD